MDKPPIDQYTKDGDVATTVRLPEELHQELRHMAVDEKVSMNQLIVNAVRRLLAGKKKKQGDKD